MWDTISIVRGKLDLDLLSYIELRIEITPRRGVNSCNANQCTI